jgi:hypothetical protein
MIEVMGLKLLHRGPLDDIKSVPNFMKIYQAVQKLLVRGTQTDKQTRRQTGDLISVLPFFETRLKNRPVRKLRDLC